MPELKGSVGSNLADYRKKKKAKENRGALERVVGECEGKKEKETGTKR